MVQRDSSKYKFIYVPGILDDIGYVQSLLVRTWRLRGINGVTHVMPWAGPSNYEASAKRLLQRIDALTIDGEKVVLVGASAGATAVINAYHKRRDQVAAVLLLCPKVNDSTNISPKLLQKNPSFLTAIVLEEIVQTKLTAADKEYFRIFISPADGLVTEGDSLIEGVETRSLPALRHNMAILYALSLGFGQLKAELQKITGRS